MIDFADNLLGHGGTRVVGYMVLGWLIYLVLKKLYNGFVMVWSINQVLRAGGRETFKHSIAAWWGADSIRKGLKDK